MLAWGCVRVRGAWCVHMAGLEATMHGSDLRRALDDHFGDEWRRLSAYDQALIVRDCTEDGGVSDIRLYRRNIGQGNLLSYVKCQRVRSRAAATPVRVTGLLSHAGRGDAPGLRLAKRGGRIGRALARAVGQAHD